MSIRIPADVLLTSDKEHMNWLRELAKLVNSIVSVSDADKGDITVTGTGTVWTIDANVVSNAKAAQMAALTVKSNATNLLANAADLAAVAASGAVLRESGSTLGFGTIATAGIGANQVTNAKLAQMAALTFKANVTGGLADPIDATVAQMQAAITYPGRLRSFQALTSGTTYTRPAGITSILVEGQGGGGGGGGCIIAGAAVSTAGAGGGAGTYGSRWYLTAPASGTYAIGTAGTAGAATGAVAGTGGSTTFTDGTTLLTLPGGVGAPTNALSTAAAATGALSLGGAGGAASTNADLNNQGVSGDGAMRLSATAVQSGTGAAGLYGGAGQGRITAGAGANARANSGAGGGGGLALNSAAVVGGAGGTGWLIVWEFA